MRRYHGRFGLTTVDNNIIIGHHPGVHSVFGQVANRCIIDNISGAPVSAATAAVVLVDSDGRLGTMPCSTDPCFSDSSTSISPKAIPDAATQTMRDRKLQDLRAMVTQQQQQIDTLTAQLKEQSAQIHNARAQLEMNKPAGKVVANKR